jgi:hypothetical protein
MPDELNDHTWLTQGDPDGTYASEHAAATLADYLR